MFSRSKHTTLRNKPITIVVVFEPQGSYDDFSPIIWKCVFSTTDFVLYDLHFFYAELIHGRPREVSATIVYYTTAD